MTNGNCNHIAWVEDGMVLVSNDNDSWYTEAFSSRSAVNAFIELIQAARDEAFPEVEVITK